ncbi:MAG: hypothetical protein H6732_06130 [Alphaproteobacteria bacterium]|nr:hypothetical protein [Alphaproteobacteria bacterium]
MRALLPLALLTACAPVGFGGPDALDTADDTGTDSGKGPDDSGDGGGNGGGAGGDGGPVEPPPCDSVCWTWVTPPAATRPVAGVAQPLDLTTCNAYGLERDVCPEDWTCGAPREVVWQPGVVNHIPLCEPDGPGPHVLEADLGPPSLPGHDVRLTFTLRGQAWPAAAAGRAGELRLRRRSDGQAVTLPLPATANGLLRAQVPEGTWDVSFTGGARGLDDATFPVITHPAILVVADDGEDEVDVDAVAVPVSVTLDGAPLTTVPAKTSSLSISFWSPHGSWTRHLSPGDRLDRPLLLPPDTWDATVGASTSDAANPLPSGVVAFPEVNEVRPKDPGAFVLPLRTATIAGTITVDGGAMDAKATAYVRVEGESGQVQVEVGSARPARYSARVFRGGSHDVWLVSHADANGLADGELLARTGVSAPATVDFDAPTVATSGTVTFNGGLPTGGYGRAKVAFHAADGSRSELAVKSLGAATWDGRAWARPADLVVGGNGTTTMGGWRRVTTKKVPTSGMTADLQGVTVQVTVKADGAPLVGDGSTYRGSLGLVRLDPASGQPATEDGDSLWGTATVGFPNSGDLVASAVVAKGAYDVRLSLIGKGVVPTGSVSLGRLDVTGPVARTWDLDTVEVAIDLLEGGTRLAAPASGDRGLVSFSGSTATVPRTGPARASFWVFDTPGFENASWSCIAAAGCGLQGYPTSVLLWYGLDP